MTPDNAAGGQLTSAVATNTVTRNSPDGGSQGRASHFLTPEMQEHFSPFLEHGIDGLGIYSRIQCQAK